jgi:hypothetical protein
VQISSTVNGRGDEGDRNEGKEEERRKDATERKTVKRLQLSQKA